MNPLSDMARADLVLFDDELARAWEPFALTRPAGELLFGTLTLRERAEQVLGIRCVAHLTASHLVGFHEQGAPPVRSDTPPPDGRPRLYLLSRAVPEWADDGPTFGPSGGRIIIGNEPAGWYAPDGEPPTDAFLADPAAHEGDPGTEIRLAGRVLRNVWELISGNADQITSDVAALSPSSSLSAPPAGVHRWGDHELIVGDGAELEPGCAINTTDGPVWIDRGAAVRSFSRVAGPAYIGPESQVLGGSVESVSLGPVCKVRGELSASVCLGYTNKQHDGHIGHAYLGRWVNLGAETTNSDLKNNYGTIRVWTPSGDTDTGEIKIGSLIGDHVKTGIGLLLNTGTVVGAGSNLYGAAMPPKFVPPFSWGSGEELVEYRSDKFMEVAEHAMSRRGVTLTPEHRDQLMRAWERGRSLWG
jgi:UDP-N-acetylglucosamine diphosphorylase/glucosamine-1-phosphate N-acetyltransferase